MPMLAKKQPKKQGKNCCPPTQNIDCGHSPLPQPPQADPQDILFRNISMQPAWDVEESSHRMDEQESLDDDHDDHCFECGQAGQLQMCSNCFRSYHAGCHTLSHYLGEKACDHCILQLERKCAHCRRSIIAHSDSKNTENFMNSEQEPPTSKSSTPESNEPYFKCTLCYCQVHYDCNQIPIEVLKSKGCYFAAEENFMCLKCITSVKIVRVVASKRVLMGDREANYYFLNAFFETPVHCFWVTETELIKRKKNNTIKIVGHPHAFDQPGSNCIQNIVDFRPPRHTRNQSFNYHAEVLYSKVCKEQSHTSEYGSSENYQFQVRWKNSRFYVWEDEKTVVKFLFALKKFIVKCVFQQKMLECGPKPLFQICEKIFHKGQIEQYTRALLDKKKTERTLNIIFGQQTAVYEDYHTKLQEKAENIFKNLSGKKSIELIENLNGSRCCTEVLCKCINQLYSGSPQKHSIEPRLVIVLTEQDRIQGWLEQLRTHCTLLEVLCWHQGKNIELCKNKQFLYKHLYYPHFQVLLTTYDVYLSEQAYICGKIKGVRGILSDKSNQPPITQFIILDAFQRDFLTFSSAKFPDFKKFVMVKQASNHYLHTQLHNQFRGYEINKFSLDAPGQRVTLYSDRQFQRVDKLFNPRVYSPDNSYCKSVKWSKAQRMAFQLHVLAYGVNLVTDIGCLWDNLCAEHPRLFGGPGSASAKAECQKYVGLYFQMVRDVRCKEIPQTRDTNQFLFFIQREKIYKRICQLAKMKSCVKQFEASPKDFPFKVPMILFKRKQACQIKSWTGVQDYALCKLILRHGFGSWHSILRDKEAWPGWIGLPIKDIRFYSYVVDLLGGSGGEKESEIEQIIQDRAEICLHTMC